MQTATLGAAALLAVSAASADILTLDTVGSITDIFIPTDAAPFDHLTTGDSINFHFEYDTDLIPISSGPDSVVYQFGGSSSWVDLGGVQIGFDSVTATVNNEGFGGRISFSGRMDALGAYAGFFLEGANELALELPTALDVLDFTSVRESVGNSDDNMLLLPNVYGTVDSVTIVPAPTGSLALALGVIGAARRRR